MSNRKWLATGILILSAVGIAGAHLDGSGMKPAGGETFTVGTATKITWKVVNLHDGKMNIDFSADNGSTWKIVKAYTASGTGTQEFNWTPDAVTEHGKIRICQTAGAAACTDAQNTSNPTSAAPYILVTPSFSVSGTSGIAKNVEQAGKDFFEFHPDTRDLDVSFNLAEAKDVLLQAFDAQGHLIATVLEGKQGAGMHKLSVFSNKLNSVSGVLVFKLKAGNEVRTQSWNTAR